MQGGCKLTHMLRIAALKTEGYRSLYNSIIGRQETEPLGFLFGVNLIKEPFVYSIVATNFFTASRRNSAPS